MLVFGTVIVLCGAMYFLADPAAEWIERAPKTMSQVERKLKARVPPAREHPGDGEQGRGGDHTHERAAMITQKVELAKPGLMTRLSGTTASFLGAALTVIFLTYFLLAAGTLFRQKLAEVLPGRAERAHVVEALAEIEVQMSRYLVLTTIINAVVGLLTWGALALLGMPNAALWGAVAGVLNYIPYVGALATLIVIGVAGLVSFDQPKTALLAAGAFFIINMIESNLATPDDPRASAATQCGGTLPGPAVLGMDLGHHGRGPRRAAHRHGQDHLRPCEAARAGGALPRQLGAPRVSFGMDSMSTGTAIALSVGAVGVIFLLTLVLVGLSVGALARFLLPGPDPMSLPATAGYGIAGSLVGGVIGRLGAGRRSGLRALGGGRDAADLVLHAAGQGPAGRARWIAVAGIFLLGTALIFLLLVFAAIGLAIGAVARFLLPGPGSHGPAGDGGIRHGRRPDLRSRRAHGGARPFPRLCRLGGGGHAAHLVLHPAKRVPAIGLIAGTIAGR